MVIIRKLPVVAHQLFFFSAQLLILKVHGIEYSGYLAYIGAISTIFSVIISLRWDIEIMVSKLKTLPDSLLDASVTIILMTIAISIVNFVFGSPIPIHIIFSGLIIAIHELLVAILFVQKKIYSYSLAKYPSNIISLFVVNWLWAGNNLACIIPFINITFIFLFWKFVQRGYFVNKYN